MDSVNVRNLEQIQESDGTARVNRLTTVFLASLGGAALVIAAVMTVQRSEPPARSSEDPLAALVAKAKQSGAPVVSEVDRKDVTFPAVLSDTREPTTALVAIKSADGRLVEAKQDAPEPAASPPVEGLPVVPLPAGELLSASAVTRSPKDDMTALAKEKSDPELPDEHVPPGAEGAFQLQVASFQDMQDAERFVAELRKRGHRAYRQAAYVADRGLWHRVRIGPFSSKYSAERYRKEFEGTERMNTFVVDTERVKRQEQLRRAEKAEEQSAD